MFWGKLFVIMGQVDTFAMEITLDIIGMCMHAAETHHMYGREVQLYSLNTQSINGRRGIIGGFNPDGGRGSVYLPDEHKKVWIKSDKMTLIEPIDPQTPRVDVQDRVGMVALHDLCLPEKDTGYPERDDMVIFSFEKHQSCINIYQRN